MQKVTGTAQVDTVKKLGKVASWPQHSKTIYFTSKKWESFSAQVSFFKNCFHCYNGPRHVLQTQEMDIHNFSWGCYGKSVRNSEAVTLKKRWTDRGGKRVSFMKGAVFKRGTGRKSQSGRGGKKSWIDRQAQRNRRTDEGIKEKQGGASMDD